MPIVDVTYAPEMAEERLKRLAQTLPHAVSIAVECPEEPYDGVLQPGDVEIRFRPRGAYDGPHDSVAPRARPACSPVCACRRRRNVAAASQPTVKSTSLGHYTCSAPYDTVLLDADNVPGGEPPVDADEVEARCIDVGQARFTQGLVVGAAAAALAALTTVLALRRRTTKQEDAAHAR
jgi:hypothetical protein